MGNQKAILVNKKKTEQMPGGLVKKVIVRDTQKQRA